MTDPLALPIQERFREEGRREERARLAVTTKALADDLENEMRRHYTALYTLRDRLAAIDPANDGTVTAAGFGTVPLDAPLSGFTYTQPPELRIER